MVIDIFVRVKTLKQYNNFWWFFIGVIVSSALLTGAGLALGRFDSRPATPCITGLIGLIPFFYAPYFLTTLINIILFILIVVRVRMIQQGTKKNRPKTHRKEFSTWVVVGIALGIFRIPLYILGAYALIDGEFTFQSNTLGFAFLQASTLIQPFMIFGAVVHNHKLFRKWRDRCTGRSDASGTSQSDTTKGRSQSERESSIELTNRSDSKYDSADAIKD